MSLSQFMKREQKRSAIIIAMLAAIFLALPVFASNTNGTIDTTNKWAWGSKIGWINFSAANGNVHVTDSGLTGSAWNDNYGWIKLDPTNGGVVNDGSGDLSGYGWNESLGWIDFSNVTISSGGVFFGQATGDNIGAVSFDCAHCRVSTDYRPRIIRPRCNNSLDDDGDGKIDFNNDPGCGSFTDDDETDPGGVALPPSAFSGPSSPALSFRIIINGGAERTNVAAVSVELFGGSDTEFVWLSENESFVPSERLDYNPADSSKTVQFAFAGGEGVKRLYVKFCTHWGHCSAVYSDDIYYTLTTAEKEQPPTAVAAAPPSGARKTLAGRVLEKIVQALFPIVQEIVPPSLPELPSFPTARLFSGDMFSKLKLLLPNLFKKPQILPSAEQMVSRVAPLPLRAVWNLTPELNVNRFIFSPLPREFAQLAQKFPDVARTFKNVGVAHAGDITKLRLVRLLLPSLTKTVGMPKPEISGPAIGAIKAVSVGSLPGNIKDKIPSDIIFAQGAQELVDYNIAVSLSNQGKPVQKITMVSGKTLRLAIRPEEPVRSVKGYIVFRSKKSQAKSIKLPLASVISSLIFAEPAFAHPLDKPVHEDELVLVEFEYTDPDGDGIYTAEVRSPIPDGEYEIITVMNYEEPGLGAKEIRLITVVDPEGYVYEKIKNQELRIAGAIASLYWLSPASKKYELWPAKEFQQENPQVTGVRGAYSFLVPEGMYYLKMEAPAYRTFVGKPFIVEEGSGIHINVEMKTGSWWLKALDWRTALLLAVSAFLVYNFYRDKKRTTK